jgi:pyruvate/2-oxoglutarate/acetoin dehydrogenase E1 component/TPP-dependent pyruvate/acetoin dehydrogenase alpha subunit
MDKTTETGDKISYTAFTQEVLEDYRLAYISRNCSIIARKEVLTGKAKFGIFGDGKELAQIAMAKQFREGDWRSGYYRDQTFLMAAGIVTPTSFFSQIYGDTNTLMNPGNSGRNFNNHFASANINPDGSWKDLTQQKNTAADLSPTAAQIPRLVGLAYASKLFRENAELSGYNQFSMDGNEVAFGMIGDASTSEGHFFEAMNAAGVLQIPMAVAVWDDGYGISVTRDLQTVKESISDALKGFEREPGKNGILIYKANGWDYARLCRVFEEGIERCRKEHIPVLFHIEEMNQPLGHSTSGSHERYKSRERLEWEKEFDPLRKMREWILETGISTAETLDEIESSAALEVEKSREDAWQNYSGTINKEKEELLSILRNKRCMCASDDFDKITLLRKNLQQVRNPIRKDNFTTARKILRHICLDCPSRKGLQEEINIWLGKYEEEAWDHYSTQLYNETARSALNVPPVPPEFEEDAEEVAGRLVLRENFDRLFAKHPLLVTFGEDTGKIGGVNQSLEGLQEKYGEHRITDTGIRETTIIGQGIGLAMRGIRPIAEIQYFDYLLYGLQTISDDLATLHYRTRGIQSAPLIIRTRGHRLEGIWHSGSPLSMVINSIRGVYICVPRDMTRAAGMYNTLLEGDDPALVIEPLNGYRLKERMPVNPGEFRIPLGIPEIIRPGKDITLVTYGSCVRIAGEAAEQLEDFNIQVELIDVQSLLPFDLPDSILASVRKTGRVVFFDEDVPGGATAYMMQKVLEEQGAYQYLDSPPLTITGRDHRPAYGTDGDYFSNPNAENVFEVLYDMMNRANPGKYPSIH